MNLELRMLGEFGGHHSQEFSCLKMNVILLGTQESRKIIYVFSPGFLASLLIFSIS